MLALGEQSKVTYGEVVCVKALIFGVSSSINLILTRQKHWVSYFSLFQHEDRGSSLCTCCAEYFRIPSKSAVLDLFTRVWRERRRSWPPVLERRCTLRRQSAAGRRDRPPKPRPPQPPPRCPTWCPRSSPPFCRCTCC